MARFFIVMDKLELVRKGFNSGAELYHEKFKNQEEYAELFQTVLNELPQKDSSILDLGCGPGNISKFLLVQNPKLKIVGVDISENMVEIAQKNNPCAKFLVQEALSFLRTCEKFNAIICGFILPYLEKNQMEELIELANKKLTKNGVLFLSTMVGNYSDSKLQSPSSGNGPQIFVHYHEKFHLIELLKKNGFGLMKEESRFYKFTESITNTDLFLVAKKNV
ncbi:MAG: class I SAM-dependent DNA methyltransferase [Salibacteraceae bacterium]